MNNNKYIISCPLSNMTPEMVKDNIEKVLNLVGPERFEILCNYAKEYAQDVKMGGVDVFNVDRNFVFTEEGINIAVFEEMITLVNKPDEQ